MRSKYLETPERYGGEPLYGNLPADYRQNERPYTVTVRGPERHGCTGPSGGPARYVLDACSTEKAWAAALAWHMAAEETPDCYVVADESYEGLPQGDHKLGCIDLRPAFERRRGLDDLADEATELTERLEAETARYRDGNGEILPGKQAAFEGAVANHRFDGWTLVCKLSALDGRD
ncbi:hypothetical protein GCM10010250_21790 [Streptomyces althioticus]|uniref:hypothetical protein n=1 Tax=Streptomyces althioticus TaxID=83380 RepID=UPI001873712D|nr:hypothetical protein GCM10010250_21790 [Streptomyces althioticus]